MKKILATLLVATMLLSCLTFVGFAADIQLETISAYPYADMSAVTDDYTWKDEMGSLYFTNYEKVTGLSGRNASNASPVYKVLNTSSSYINDTGAQAAGVMPATVKAGDLVALPLYTTGASAVALYISYDPAVLRPSLSTKVKYTQMITEVAGESGKIFYQGASAEAGVISGLYSVVYFEILDSATTANQDGNDTTEITLSLGDDGVIADGPNNGVLGSTTTMTVALSGLTYAPEEPAVKEDVTVDDFAPSAGVVTSVAPAAAKNVPVSEAVNESKVNFVAGNADSDINNAADDAVYSAVFATVDLTGKNAPEAYGFVIIPDDGTGARFYEAKAGTVVNGKYGMVFFGDAATLGLYKAAPAVKVNGTWIYDAANASDL